MLSFKHIAGLQQRVLESKVLTAFLCCCPLISGASLVNNACTWSSLLALGEAIAKLEEYTLANRCNALSQPQKLKLCRCATHDLMGCGVIVLDAGPYQLHPHPCGSVAHESTQSLPALKSLGH